MTNELNSRDECPAAARGGPEQRYGDGLLHKCGSGGAAKKDPAGPPA